MVYIELKENCIIEGLVYRYANYDGLYVQNIMFIIVEFISRFQLVG